MNNNNIVTYALCSPNFCVDLEFQQSYSDDGFIKFTLLDTNLLLRVFEDVFGKEGSLSVLLDIIYSFEPTDLRRESVPWNTNITSQPQDVLAELEIKCANVYNLGDFMWYLQQKIEEEVLRKETENKLFISSTPCGDSFFISNKILSSEETQRLYEDEQAMELKNIKKTNLKEAKKQYDEEKKNAEIAHAKRQIEIAQDNIDMLDRHIRELEEKKQPYLEILEMFK